MPRDTLTREQVVTAAIDLMDAQGLDGLNMRALGRRLCSAATAVYWHVGSKANLITLAGDQAWGEVTLPDPAAVGWRAAATAMATGLHAMLTRHPWVVQAFGSYPLFGPGKARHDDHLLAIYEAAGFPAGKADQATAAVVTYVLGNALGPAAAASLTRELSRDGVRFDTDNDSEVAARYIAHEMASGADLADALRATGKVFDGFFTLLLASGDGFAVVRDSFACKPMVVAETADYVAVASEYVALAHLPGVEKAEVFEPMPEEIYTWQD